jgi:hypothetical protein
LVPPIRDWWLGPAFGLQTRSRPVLLLGVVRPESHTRLPWCKFDPLAAPPRPFQTMRPGERVMDGRTFLRVLVESLFAVALIIGAHPVAGHAEQVGRIYRVGILSSTDPARPNENYVMFRERLRELGWSEGRNLAVEERNIGPDRERLDHGDEIDSDRIRDCR